MKFELHTQGLEVTEKLRAHVERRLRFAFTRFGDKVRRIHVRIADLNGPKGGYDIECKVRAELGASGDLVIRDVDRDPFSAVARVTDRIGHAVSRRIDRLNARRRGRGSRSMPPHPATSARSASEDSDD